MPRFARYIGIDYSGAQTADDSLAGLRVYLAERDGEACEVAPPPSPRYYFTRREIADWLVETLSEGPPALVGIDHGFSFPLAYFVRHDLPLDWPAFLDDFQRHWPTDAPHLYVDFIREGIRGDGASRMGSTRWRRLAEVLCRAKSVFHFDVPGSVAKSTHAGLPWLRYLRRELGARVHFWPFDGWEVSSGQSVIAEAYPALVSHRFAMGGRTRDQHDAYSLAAWLSAADHSGELGAHLDPPLSASVRELASIEGWILGVPGERRAAGA